MADGTKTLPHEVTFPVLGVPTRFLASDAFLLDPVRAAFAAWGELGDHPGLLASNRVTVRLFRRDGPGGDGPRTEVRYAFPHPGRLVVTTPGSRGVADLASGRVSAWVTDALVGEEYHFRYAFLSALTLAAVTAHDRIALHAAAVVGRSGAVLLHGPSGVGKSSLALAAAERGLGVLSEDVVYVERERGPRVWGMPGPIHVGPDALRFFPSLRPTRTVVRGGGRMKHAVEPPREPGAPLFTRRAGTCLLERSGGRARLLPTTVREVRAAVGSASEPGFDLFRDVAPEAAEVVTRCGAWRLDLGSDPHAALPILEELVAGIDAGGGADP